MRILKTLSVKAAVNVAGNLKYSRMEPLHSGGEHLCKFIETKETIGLNNQTQQLEVESSIELQFQQCNQDGSQSVFYYISPENTLDTKFTIIPA